MPRVLPVVNSYDICLSIQSFRETSSFSDSTTKTKVVKIIIASAPVQKQRQILLFPFSTNAGCPTSLTILPVRGVPSGLVPIHDCHDARVGASRDEYVTRVEVRLCEDDVVLIRKVMSKLVGWGVMAISIGAVRSGEIIMELWHTLERPGISSVVVFEDDVGERLPAYVTWKAGQNVSPHSQPRRSPVGLSRSYQACLPYECDDFCLPMSGFLASCLSMRHASIISRSC
jgi:hypothetical protein